MRKITAKKLGEEFSLTKSSVSRMLNNSCSFNINNKNAIRNYLEENDLYVAKKSHINNKNKIIGIAMPINPNYFWKIAVDGINDAIKKLGNENTDIKFAFYSDNNYDEISYCLNTLISFNVDAVAFVPMTNDKRLLEMLNKLSLNLNVFMFNEYIQSNKCAMYIGPDYFNEGIMAGQTVADMLPDRNIIICKTSLTTNMYEKRISGFIESLAATGNTNIIDIIDIENGSLGSSKLARIIDEKYRNIFNCVYAADGILPTVCGALRKLNIKKSIFCIGHETPPQIEEFIKAGILSACICQDIYSEGFLLIKNILEYQKDNKTTEFVFIKSEKKIFVSSNKEEI